jgi:hypothetical protein
MTLQNNWGGCNSIIHRCSKLNQHVYRSSYRKEILPSLSQFHARVCSPEIWTLNQLLLIFLESSENLATQAYILSVPTTSLTKYNFNIIQPFTVHLQTLPWWGLHRLTTARFQTFHPPKFTITFRNQFGPSIQTDHQPEEWRVLGCYALWLFEEPFTESCHPDGGVKFFRNVGSYKSHTA